MPVPTYKQWCVTVTRGSEIYETTVYAKDRSQAIKFARSDVANSMPFYKTGLDGPTRVTYRAEPR